ncbi:MAG: glycosyltransferase [Burkholderiaceae bacterium]|nr:glycosyltransferase [Burkholderiaceae bacterium]
MTEIVLCLLVLPALLPAFALLALTLAAGAPARATPTRERPPGLRLAVLVPAHDESLHVLPTIASLQAQLAPQDRLLVVADNCSDDTAALARAAGAEVVERHDPTRRGKGHALAHGVDHLRRDPPDVVLVVDADCSVDPGAVSAIVAECHHTARPVQMLDLMHAPSGAGLRHRVLEFAMVMKNLVRPLGSHRLGGVCQLMGTGMALPWRLIEHAPLATGHVAEDMKLGMALTVAGHPPRFLAGARVRSAFVADGGVARRQKARWEHGHLDTMREELPAALALAVTRRDRALAVLALDLVIPPVALYFLLMAALLAVAGAAGAGWAPARPAATLVATGAACFGLAIGMGWWRFGRQLLSPAELLRLPLYALWKLPVYVAYLAGMRSGWVRTQRPSAPVGKC